MELSREEREEAVLGIPPSVSIKISEQEVIPDPYTDFFSFSFPFEEIGIYLYMPAERVNGMSLEEFKEKTLNNSIAVGKLRIEEEEDDHEKTYEELYGDEWWFPNTLYKLGEENFKAQLDSLLTNSIPTMWRKFRFSLSPFVCDYGVFGSGSGGISKSVVVEFKKSPSILEIIKTHCYLGSNICLDGDRQEYNIIGISICGRDGILDVGVDYRNDPYYRWED